MSGIYDNLDLNAFYVPGFQLDWYWNIFKRLEQQVKQRSPELETSQFELIQREKIASLGELTAGNIGLATLRRLNYTV